jgi:hypothetical protein
MGDQFREPVKIGRPKLQLSHHTLKNDQFFFIVLCFSLLIYFSTRYKIYAEGYAWSVSLKYILSCGSVALIISPQYEDFFTRGLVPNRNFLPVNPRDLCPSIKRAVDWGNKHTREVFLYSLLFIPI